MSVQRKRIRILLIVLAVGLAYLCFVRLTGLYIPCPVRTLSGGHLSCPGCGVSHMCESLSRFQFAEAFRANPVILCLLPVWGVALVFWVLDRGVLFRKITVWGSVVALMVFGVLRNIL